ncbi:MAG: exo-alpha-sialidase [Alphaproteobacteria bacterium]|nr:exo-alpha-sialidase [Alphaproteobacteria bacterium]MCB9794417.1 exo-alpha-sialidase [Alphaproteobacteria bacterium]
MDSRPRGLVWDFEHAALGDSLSVAEDSSGEGLNGAAEAPLGVVLGARPGRLAVALSGETALVLDEADALTDLQAGEPLRLQLAFRTWHHGQGEAGVLAARGDAENGWSLSVREGRLVFALSSEGGGAELSLQSLVSDGRWHRVVAGRRADGALVLGVDGVEQASGDSVPGAVDAEGPLRVGALMGSLDELRLDREAPSLAEPMVERERVRVFSKREVPAGGVPARYDTVRIPALLETPSGALLAVAEGRVDSQCDWGDVDAVVKRSEDGGRTWSAAQVVVNPGEYRVGNPVPVADAASGRIFLITTTYALDEDACAGSSSEACTCTSDGERPLVEVRASEDDGLTWGEPIDISDVAFPSAWRGITHGPGHGFQRADGTLVIPAGHRDADGGPRGGHLLVSADGVTWTVGVTQSGGDVNVNESSAAELPDGAIVITTRNQYGSSSVDWALREAGLRGQARLSADLEWADSPEYSLRPDLRAPVVFGSILQLTGGALLGEEDRTVLSVPAGEHGSNYGQRHDLRLWTSEDGAETWREGARVQGGWAAYSDLAPIGESGLGILVEGAALSGSDITYYDHIDLLRLARQPLDDLTLAAWSFEGEDPAASAGPAGLRLSGSLNTTEGAYQSTALAFTGAGPLCASADDARGWVDFGVRDAFEVEVSFRTTAHVDGGSRGAGALVSRTATGTLPGWWLRVQDGRLRFLVGTCDAESVNCGIIPGYCEALSDCVEGDVWSEEAVADGAWHTVLAGRDPIGGQLYLSLDGGEPQLADFDFRGIVKNEEPLCLGAFSDGARAFVGELDHAAVRIGEPPR